MAWDAMALRSADVGIGREPFLAKTRKISQSHTSPDDVLPSDSAAGGRRVEQHLGPLVALSCTRNPCLDIGASTRRSGSTRLGLAHLGMGLSCSLLAKREAEVLEGPAPRISPFGRSFRSLSRSLDDTFIPDQPRTLLQLCVEAACHNIHR